MKSPKILDELKVLYETRFKEEKEIVTCMLKLEDEDFKIFKKWFFNHPDKQRMKEMSMFINNELA